MKTVATWENADDTVLRAEFHWAGVQLGKSCVCAHTRAGAELGGKRKPEFPFTRSGIVSDSFSDFWYCGNKYAINTYLYECVIVIIISLAFREGS